MTNLNTLQYLTTYDILIDQGGNVTEIVDTDNNSQAEAFGNDVSIAGALPFEFIELGPNVEILRLYFAVPFTGNQPVLLQTPDGFDSGAWYQNSTQFTNLASGAASTVPEPATWLLTMAGAAFLVWKRFIKSETWL